MEVNDIKQGFIDSKGGEIEYFVNVYNEILYLNEELKTTIEDAEAYRYAYDYAYKHFKKKLADEDFLMVNLALVQAYNIAKYPWRGKEAASRVLLLAEKSKDMNDMVKSELYIEMADFYRSVSLYAKAAECFDVAYRKNNNPSILYDLIVCHKYANPNYVFFMSDKEITEKCKEYAPQIFNVIDGKGYILIDPIENSEEFQKYYDELHELMRERVLQEGDLNLEIQSWNILEELYLEKGITWKSPSKMNPKVMFD